MRTHLSSFFKSPAIRRWTLFTVVLTPLLATLAATQPAWWSSGDHPILNDHPANNLGTANLGQAKHMAASAIEALREVAPVVAGNIEADLAGTVDLTVPNPQTPEWLARQQGALVLGQLKALATPFYDRLHSVAPEWLEQQRAAAGSQHTGTHLPWTPDTIDDANTSPANIGQLKAVFALDFATLPAASLDSDGDDMPDAWEIANGLNANDPADANEDPDSDGLTNAQEQAIEGNPNVADNPGIVQDAIRNGDFTEPAILGGGLETTQGATGWNYWAGIPGWTAVEGENIELQNLDPDGGGNPYVELKAHPEGHYGIKQTIGTRKGINYLVIFRCKPRGDVPAQNSNMEVKVNGANIKSVTFMDDLEWQTYYATFKADRVISQLSFVPSVTPNDTLGCLVDGINLLPVEVRDIKDSTNAGDDVTITPWDTATQTNPTDANIAWIEPHKSATDAAPRMPQLELKITGLPATMTIQAKIEVQYTRGNGARAARNQAEDRVRIPADGSFQTVTGDTWKIWEAYAAETFFGGEATLTYKLMTGTTETLGPQIIRFRIGGKNPDAARARNYIETLTNCSSTGSLWFAYAIAKSESKDYNGGGSRYNQFWQLPRDANDTAYRAARQTHAGRPVWGNDGGTTPGGYGMFQVTGNAAESTANIPRQEIWNWQENARAGRAILESKRTTADAWITRQKNTDNANGVALPSLTVRNVTFAEGGNRTMNNAVTMKAWNGASAAPAGFTDSDGAVTGFIIDPQSGGHFCYWKNSATITKKWALSRYNNPPGDIQPFNYVDRVCQEVE